MNKETQEKALKALELNQARYKKHNAWVNDTYDRQQILLPKGMRERLKEAAESNGESVNAFVNRLIAEEFKRIGK